MKQKDLEDLVLSIIVIIAFFVSGLLYLVKVSLRIRFNAIQFSKHDVSLILITISSSVFSLLLSYLMDQKDLEALVLSIIFISMFSVRILLQLIKVRSRICFNAIQFQKLEKQIILHTILCLIYSNLLHHHVQVSLLVSFQCLFQYFEDLHIVPCF